MIRHTRGSPCPVCGGHDTMPRGKEVRCMGYTSDDGKWCFCARGEGGHHTVETPAGQLYAHLLRDEPLEREEHFHDRTTSNDNVGQSNIVAEYNYLDDDGELAYQVVRLEPKSFRQRRPNGAPGSWVWSTAGIKRWMYRRAEVAGAEGVVFLVEGEKDADALYELGLTATTSSGGAKGAKESYEDGKAVLAGLDVCIIADADADGATYAEGWRTALEGVAKNVRIVRTPDGKDASDYIQAGATASAFLKLWTDAASKPAELYHGIEWRSLAEMAKPLPPIRWLVEQLKVGEGPCSCFAGYGYSGKTAILQNIMLCMATGRSLFGLWKIAAAPVGWLDYEQGWRMSAERMQRQARGMDVDLADVDPKMLRYADFPDVYLSEKDTTAVDRLARAVDGLQCCLLDSARALTPGIDENDSRIRVPFDALSRVTKKTGCVFIVIHHYGKSGDGTKPLKERMRGSSALFDAMQTVWGLDRAEGDDFTRLVIAKDRLTNANGLTFGVRFIDDTLTNSVKLQHLDPEQMKRPTKALLYMARVLEVVKTHPKLTSVEAIRFRMPEGFRNLNETRSAVRELEEDRQLSRIGDGYVAL